MPTNAEMVDYIWPISTNYVFGGSRWEPYNTDCSGMVCAAYWHVHGISPYTLGTWTGGQWSSPETVEIWRGTTPNLPWDIMEKGDMIFTGYTSPEYNTGNGSHVGFYTGNPNAPFLSHYANGGPDVTAVNGVYGGCEKYYGVKRYLPGSEEDMKPVEVWAYTNPSESIDAYQALMETHRAVTGKGISSWGYMNPSEEIDAYKALMDVHAAVGEMTTGKLEASIDYEKLADVLAPKLADIIAERMRD